jgi:hypothetical protein
MTPQGNGSHTSKIYPADRRVRHSLARSGHTLSVVGNTAFIFGGETASGQLAGNDVHSVTLPTSENPNTSYDIISASAFAEEGKVPAARKRHAACALNERIAVFGGVDGNGTVISEGTKLWMFDTGKSKWEELEAFDANVFPKPRSDAHLFMSGDANNVVLYGGIDANGTALKDAWHFNCLTRNWSELPEAPVSSSHAVLSDGVLYLVSATDSIGGDLHQLPLPISAEEEPSWSTIQFPTNPLTPGPAARNAAGLLPISTGYGRQYLVYLFGALAHKGGQAEQSETTGTPQPTEQDKATTIEYCSDIWTYQLPSSDPEIKVTTNFTEAIKPAKIKDKIRGALGLDDGKHSWGEAVVVPPTELPESEGKVHPGPRASFACDVMSDKQSVVIWGGVNPKGEMENDGWIIKLE